jgi:hypothetical protein
MRLRLSLLGSLFVGALLLGGCQTAEKEVSACPTVPPNKVEGIPKPPVSEDPLLWQPGHWDWNGSSYSWREGVWIKRNGRGNQFMEGHWERDTVPNPCNWVPWHWL